MHCVAIIEASQPGLDSVIVWDDGTQLVAFAYEDGRVKMTRPLVAQTTDDGVSEARDSFQIMEGQVTRIRDRQGVVVPTETFSPVPQRWGA